jgi:ABC-type transporter Mla subunit MlaD
VLTAAAAAGTLTGPEHAPHQATTDLQNVSEHFRAARDWLDAAWQTLSPVGGWLSADAQDLAGDGEE